MKQKILIVDDKPENLFTLEDLINENLDVEVFKATSGNEALKLFLHNNFSLAILDVQMPEMDGYDLAKYIRSRAESRATPIVFLSAVYSDEFHVFKGYESGGVDFVTKPFNPQLLLNKIRFFIRLKDEEIKRRQIEDHLQELVAARTFELNKAKLEAERANEAKSIFLTTMSHEIRTPLHALLGMANLLKDTGLTTEQAGYLTTICQSGELLISIINDILDFSKIESGKLELESLDFEFNSAISQIIAMYENRAAEKGLALTYINNIRQDLYVLSDPVRIKQIINNLLNNAIKFTETGGVTISTAVESRTDSAVRLVIIVKDTGIGIEADSLKKLFQPFTQADGSITRRYGGSGLGLSIIRLLLLELNGTIAVESTAGQGSTFTVKLMLPAGRKSQAVVAGGNTTLEYPDAVDKGELQILVAEDGEFNKILIKEYLSRINCEFDIAANGKVAVEKFAAGNYDLVLMDCQMPVLDGYEAARLIRATERGRNTPIVALTADAVKGTREKCLAAGMDDYLSKPFTKEKLLEKISRWFVVTAAISEYDSRTAPQPEIEEAELLSAAVLAKLYRDVGEDAYAIIDCFVEMIPDFIDRIDESYRNGEIRRLNEECHMLKGSSAAIGALQLSRDCDLIAHYSDTLAVTELGETIARIIAGLRQIGQRLAAVCAARSLAGM